MGCSRRLDRSALRGADAASIDFPVLTTLIVLPVIGAVVCLLVSRSRPELVRQLALLFSGTTGAISVWVLVNFERADPGFQFTEHHTLGQGPRHRLAPRASTASRSSWSC